jgi:hypothetical protein
MSPLHTFLFDREALDMDLYCDDYNVLPRSQVKGLRLRVIQATEAQTELRRSWSSRSTGRGPRLRASLYRLSRSPRPQKPPP